MEPKQPKNWASILRSEGKSILTLCATQPHQVLFHRPTRKTTIRLLELHPGTPPASSGQESAQFVPATPARAGRRHCRPPQALQGLRRGATSVTPTQTHCRSSSFRKRLCAKVANVAHRCAGIGMPARARKKLLVREFSVRILSFCEWCFGECFQKIAFVADIPSLRVLVE